ncbi:phenylacetate--CoA ligase family protein [Ferrovibrio xuzhouensis]|uniref:Phenylacetate--CoA ligase family protein n=1 Tax=Ferrovibrio xuzhouensis TaxID=1576914 RepID=A0ABV7VIB0_9PROT
MARASERTGKRPKIRADEYYDRRETRGAAARQKAQIAALQALIVHAKKASPYYREILKGVKPAAITSLAALAKLPVTRKSDLAPRQQARPPLGGLEGGKPAEIANYFQSPGPLYEAYGRASAKVKDPWRFARALWAVGCRPGDLVHNTFSYHLTPAGRMTEGSAHAIGCPVFPAGIGNTELQLDAIAQLKPRVYCGTPSFLKILLEKGAELGRGTASLKTGLVGGEALPPSLRAELQAKGVAVLQSYGTAELGLIAYESAAMEGMIIDEDVIVEIVRPGTSEPVAPGEVGEVVVTVLANPVYPMIRFATGDLSALMPGVSPCGRTNSRIRGWMGRADQTTKVKGMFVTPGQIAQVAARHPDIARARLEVTSENNVDAMVLKVEVRGQVDAGAVAATLQAVCKLRGQVEVVAAGSLPNDGKVIADLRTYQ